MNRLVFLVLVITALFCSELKAQKIVPPDREKTILALTPVKKHKVINGLAIGLTAKPYSDAGEDLSVNINGLNMELGPMGIVGGTFGLLYGFGGYYFKDYSKDTLTPPPPPEYSTYVRGVSLSVFGITETYNHGLFLNGLAGYCNAIRGVQLSGLANHTTTLRGLSMATIANVAGDAKGVQIGLINNCSTGNVVQIGLFNRIGKRVIPFINLRMKREKARG